MDPRTNETLHNRRKQVSAILQKLQPLIYAFHRDASHYDGNARSTPLEPLVPIYFTKLQYN